MATASSPLTHRGPFLLHEALIPTILLNVALCIPDQTWLTPSIFLPAILASHYHLLHTTSANPGPGYAIGTYVAMHTYISLNLLIFSNPRRDFKRLPNGYSPPTAPPPAGEPYPSSLSRRIPWVLELTQNLRGISWNWQIRPIPPIHPAEHTSVSVFFRRRLTRLFLIWGWLEFLCWLMRDLDRAFWLPEGDAFHNPDTFTPIYSSLFASPARSQEFPPPRGLPAWVGYGVVRGLLAGSAMYATVNAPYTIEAVIAAGLGCVFGLGPEGGWRRRWWDWRAWPDIFGGLREGDWGRGVHGWWGTAWHGLFKNTFVAPGRYIIARLGLRKDGSAATAISLTVPFIMSAGLHYAGSFTQSGGGWGCVRFFLLQPVGIAFERAVLYGYRRCGVRSKTLEWYAPYLWAIVWFSVTSPSFLAEYRYGGVWSTEPIPVSVVSGIRGEGWWFWGMSRDGRTWWKWHESLGGWGIQL